MAEGERDAAAASWRGGRIEPDVALAPLCTLEVGGPARYFLSATDDETVAEGVRWARGRGLGSLILGGGSNLVVADAGVDALVVRMAQRGIQVRRSGAAVELEVRAGERWDDLVGMAVAEGWTGLECLSGIPGSAGAVPIQNVGAYGVEVSDMITSVRVLDLATLSTRELPATECAFSYRWSAFRASPGRLAVLAVRFALEAGLSPHPRYPELAALLAPRTAGLPPGVVREAVLALRRSKSMVVEEGDENRRSAGSFFVNPVVSRTEAAAAVERAVAGGIVATAEEVPAFPVTAGRVKLSAGWLVEHAGFPRGSGVGPIGVSTRHALALVNRGGARSADLITFARAVRAAVRDRFGVELTPEPVFWGFAEADPVAGPPPPAAAASPPGA